MKKVIDTIDKLSTDIANDKISLNDANTRIDAYIDWVKMEEYADKDSVAMLKNNMIGAVTHLSNTKQILGKNFLYKDLLMMGDVLTAFINN